MYNWVETSIGTVPSGYEWIYGVGTIIMYIAFIIMLCAPIIIIFNMLKRR